MSHLRITTRRLAQAPSFTLLAVLTLALALGANAAIFSIVDAVLLRPLPYSESERLIEVGHAAPGLDLPRLDMAGRLYVHYRQFAESFEDIGLYTSEPVSISDLEQPVQLRAGLITPSILSILEVSPARGRAFTEEEGAPGGAGVILVSHRFWQQYLGGSPDVLGRRLTVDGLSREIVGVMAPGFAFPDADLDLWLPDVVDPETAVLGSFGRQGIARLKDGAGLDLAHTDLMRFVGDLENVFPEDQAATVLAQADMTVKLRPLHEAVVGDVGSVLWLLLGTVGFVLLLAAMNVANLFLARAEGRRREIAIRSALGAGRSSLMSAALAEGLLLSSAAGVLGLGLGFLVQRLLLQLAPELLPRLSEVTMDWRTAMVVAVLSVSSGLLFVLIPVARQRPGAMVMQLKDGGRSGLGRERHRTRRALVAAQMAIAMMLLVGAGLMARSYQRLSRVEPGFRVDNAVSFRLSLPENKAEHDTDIDRFYSHLLERLAALPGVESAASSDAVPLTGRRSKSGHRTKDNVDRGQAEVPTVFVTQQISPDYFTAMGIPLVEGRPLERADFDRSSHAVVVSRALAQREWPGQSAVGKRIFPGTPRDGERWFEVVGVAGDVRNEGLEEPPSLVVYYPWLSNMEDLWLPRAQTVVLRTSMADPKSLMDAARQVVWSLDGDLPLAEVATLQELVDQDRSRHGFAALLILIAAGLALTLGAIGTYGVISYLVSQRTGEIGVRMALGARRRDVLGLVLREGLILAGTGCVIGLTAAAALSRFLEASLYEIDPLDPVTFSVVPLVLFTVATIAGLVPARRAAGTDPMPALRHD